MLPYALITLLTVHYTSQGVIHQNGKMEFIYRIPEQWAEQNWRKDTQVTKHNDASINQQADVNIDIQNTTAVRKEHDTSCKYEGLYYKSGETHVTDCVTCQCHNGIMSCTVTTCRKHPECIRYETDTKRCCPECVEWGCFHEGVGYPRGARIPTPSCQVCYCPWNGGTGGKARCSRVTCPPAQCVDGKVPAGKCCPVCPHGPNCWMGDLVIPFGQDVWIAPCRSCACPPLNVTAHAGLKAVCKWHNSCSFG